MKRKAGFRSDFRTPMESIGLQRSEIQESGFRNHKSDSRQKAGVAQVPLGACPGLPGDLRHFKAVGRKQEAVRGERNSEFIIELPQASAPLFNDSMIR